MNNNKTYNNTKKLLPPLPAASKLLDALRAEKFTGKYHTTGQQSPTIKMCPACKAHALTAEHLFKCSELLPLQLLAKNKTINYFKDNNNVWQVFCTHFNMQSHVTNLNNNLYNEITTQWEDLDDETTNAIKTITSKKTTITIMKKTMGYTINNHILLNNWGMDKRAEAYSTKHKNNTDKNNWWIYDEKVIKLFKTQTLQHSLQHMNKEVLHLPFEAWVKKETLNISDIYSPKNDTHHLHQTLLHAISLFYASLVLELHPMY